MRAWSEGAPRHARLSAAGALSEELTPEARATIENRSNEIFVSAVAGWESLKVGLGKLTVPGDPAIWFPARVRSLGFAPLSIDVSHALAAAALPKLHSDPFDRVMIAQAQLEGMTLITRDAQSLRYPIHTLLA